jgi:Zn-dependent protease with chaperone function
MTRVWHYDGASGIRYEPELTTDENGFRLALEGDAGVAHLWTDLTYAGERAGAPTYGLKGRRGWRIGFIDTPKPEIWDNLPKAKRYGGFIDKIGLWPAAGAFVVLSAAALVVALEVPQWLAPLVPQSFERKLGTALVGDFGGRVCNGPGAEEALNALVHRIEPKTDDIKVSIANINMVNAVALPGGNIMVFRGLLQTAKSPDELAGVVGHEIGHVHNRDVMQALLRQMGLSILLGGANTDVGGTLNSLVSATYSREAEAAADQYSIRAMRQGSVSPMDTAAFFARLAEMEKSMGKAKAALGYVASHPLSEMREKEFRKSAVAGKAYTPVVSPEQWRAIVDACKNDPDVEGDGSLFF